MDIHRAVRDAKLVIVDFDGTLVRRLEVDWDSLKKQLRMELGGETFSDGLDNDLYRLRRLDKDAFLFLCKMISEAEEKGYHGETGLLKILGGKKTAIFSSNTRTAIEKILQRKEFSNFKPFIVAKEDVKKPKPNPEGLKMILEHFGVKASEAVFIGDSETDHKAGKKIGVTTITWSASKE